MTRRFLDTNIILRHLLNDHPQQSPAARALIQAIEDGQTSVWTSDLVISELVFVLSSKRLYNLSRDEVRDRLLPLIELPGIELAHKRVYQRIFELYTSLSIDFNDCYHAGLLESRKEHELWSFDTDFDKVAGLHRAEPSLGPAPDQPERSE